jgi:hypothetical protein
MADHGAVGTLLAARLSCPLGRTAFSLARRANPIGAILVAEQPERSFPYPEDLRRVAGTVVHPRPPEVAVILRHWTTRRIIAVARPDGAGAWSARVPAGNYDIAYLADGHAPVCHGPYRIDAAD